MIFGGFGMAIDFLELSRKGGKFKCVRYSVPWEPETHNRNIK